MRFLFLFFLLVSLSAGAQQLDAFKLKNINDNSYVTLGSLVKGSKFLVVISQGGQCPLFRRYVPTIHRLSKKFENQSVRFILINSLPTANAEVIKKEISEFDIQLPVYIDDKQMFAKIFDVKTLSGSVLIDTSSGKALYKGAIDNRVKHSYVNEQGANYLDDALTSALKGEEIKEKETKSEGCIIQIKN